MGLDETKVESIVLGRAEEQGLHLSYPFSAIVGQRRAKLALVLAAIDPGIGGVVLRGAKGTAKSLMARALAGVLPARGVIKGCPVGCFPGGWLCERCRDLPRPLPVQWRQAPFVELPVGASVERVVGGIDLEKSLGTSRVEWRPGLLAEARGGLLYVDELNLLEEGVGRVLSGVMGTGRVVVEREGLSVAYPWEGVVVGSYNPEEGELPPGFLDKFGLVVDVEPLAEPGLRALVVRRALEWEADKEGFQRSFAGREQELAARIGRARARLKRVEVGQEVVELAAKLAAEVGAAGHRGELALVRAARALAALRGEQRVREAMLWRLAPLALGHRVGALGPGQGQEVLSRLRRRMGAQPAAEPRRVVIQKARARGHRGGVMELTQQLQRPGQVEMLPMPGPRKEPGVLGRSGRRAARMGPGGRGRYVRASAQRLGRPIALDATLRAAAPYQKIRGAAGQVVLRPWDLREKVLVARRGRLVVFCVDASGSMNAAARMQATKEAVLGLLMEAYQKRDKVGLVAFGGRGARVLLSPTHSVELARRMLSELPSGGKTPLAAGLVELARVLEKELRRDPGLKPVAVILTDGRPNVPLAMSLGEQVDPAKAGNKGGGWGDGWGDGGYADREVLGIAQAMGKRALGRFIVVDIDTGHPAEINLCEPLARYLGGVRVGLGEVSARGLVELVRRLW